MTTPDHWHKGKSFTTDWTTVNFETWTRLIATAEVRNVLEIGSWEGRSAIFFLEHCPNCQITCIDTFEGGNEHIGMDQIASIEARFDYNLASYGGRVEKIKSRSIPALDRLGEKGRQFDVIYIDGSHARDDVVMDSFLAWRLLKQGALLMWDDYRWQLALPERERPQQAIDFFLKLHANELDVIHVSGQVIVRKRAFGDKPTPPPGLKVPRTLKNFFRVLTSRPITNLKT